MSKNYDDTTAATMRFYAMTNANLAARGLPPITPPAAALPPSMKAFVSMKRNGETEAFIAENERRISQGLPPLSCKGTPILPQQMQSAPVETGSDMTAFFEGKVDFEGRPNPAFAGVNVKRYGNQ